MVNVVDDPPDEDIERVVKTNVKSTIPELPQVGSTKYVDIFKNICSSTPLVTLKVIDYIHK